jgi:hypothetical protein
MPTVLHLIDKRRDTWLSRWKRILVSVMWGFDPSAGWEQK